MASEEVKRPRKGARSLSINGDIWWYRVGKGDIEVWDPNGKKHVTNMRIVTKRSWDVIERGQWKKTSDGAVTPKDVTNWILMEDFG